MPWEVRGMLSKVKIIYNIYKNKPRSLMYLALRVSNLKSVCSKENVLNCYCHIDKLDTTRGSRGPEQIFNIRYSTCYCKATDQLSILWPRRESSCTGLKTESKVHLCSCCVFHTCSIFWLLVLSEAFVYISNRFLLAKRALLMSAESQRIFRN